MRRDERASTQSDGRAAEIFFMIPTLRLTDDVDARVDALRRSRLGFVFVDASSRADAATTTREAFARAKEFFARPIDEKMTCATSSTSGRGYTRLGAERLDVEASTRGDTKEGFYVGRDGAPWPADFDEFRVAAENAYAHMYAVARDLLPTFGRALGVPDDYFDEDFGPGAAGHACVLRLLRYAATPSDVEEGRFACGAHTDYGLFTLLAVTDSVPGLQVYDDDADRWIPVRPPRDDLLILNVGDLMEFWSAGVFKSTRHRVVTDGDRERYSMPFFVEPNHACVITPIARASSTPAPTPTTPTTFGDYLAAKYRATYGTRDARE